MKLAHASIPADDPKVTARVLAEILDGEALRFPPGGPEAWMAWSGDGAIELEVVPRGRVLHFDGDQGNWRDNSGEKRRLCEVHLAIAVEQSAEAVMAIAGRAGWPARHSARGGGLFDLVEVWVDGSFLIEFLDPRQAARYDEVVTLENWKGLLARMEAA
jgi:hypothetical protein